MTDYNWDGKKQILSSPSLFGHSVYHSNRKQTKVDQRGSGQTKTGEFLFNKNLCTIKSVLTFKSNFNNYFKKEGFSVVISLHQFITF